MRKLLLSLTVLAGAVALNTGANAAPAVSAVAQFERPASVQPVAWHRYYHRRYYHRHYRHYGR